MASFLERYATNPFCCKRHTGFRKTNSLQYESFWEDPAAAPLTWIGLLFSIMCISTQFYQLAEDPADPDTLMRANIFRDRTIHCLVLSQFTRGGPHVLETMINNIGSEVFLCKDPDIGLWLLLGILVQIALSLGYHRDPSNFPTMSPFTEEIRRRVWAAIVQLDYRLSSQMGLPRLLKSHQCDTADHATCWTQILTRQPSSCAHHGRRLR